MDERQDDSLFSRMSEDLNRALGRSGARFPSFEVPNSAAVGRGELFLGWAADAELQRRALTRLPLDALRQNLFLGGVLGSGKSTLMAAIYAQVMAHGVNLTAFDFTREVAQILLGFFGPERVKVGDVATPPLNPFAPLPMEDASAIINRQKRLWGELRLLDGTINFLDEHCRQIGVGRSDNPPTYGDLLDHLRGLKYKPLTRTHGFWESAVNRVGELVSNIPAFAGSSSVSMLDLADQTWIIELPAISTSPGIINFYITNWILSALIIEERRAQGRLRRVFGVDELHLLASKEREFGQFAGGPSVIVNALRAGRKWDIGWVTADQYVSGLAPEVLALTNSKLILSLVSHACAVQVGGAMALTPEQQEVFPLLPWRYGLLHSKSYDNTQAFLLRVPDMKLPRVSREEVDAAKERLAREFAPAKVEDPASAVEDAPKAGPDEHRVAGKVGSMPHKAAASKGSAPETAPTPPVVPLQKYLLDHLAEIARSPFESAVERDKRLGLSGYMGNRLRSELLDGGWIESYQIRLSKRGAPTSFLYPSDKGVELLRQFGVKYQPLPGKGSSPHKLEQCLVAKKVRADWPSAAVTVEDGSLGKAVDVLVSDGGVIACIEISDTTTPTNEMYNIQQDLKICQRVVVVARTPEHLAAIKELADAELGPNDRRRVSFATITEFLHRPFSMTASLL